MTRLLLSFVFLLPVLLRASDLHPLTEGDAPAAEEVSGEPGEAAIPGPPPPEVFFTLLPSAVEGGEVRAGTVRRMVDTLAMAVTGQNSVAASWRSLVEPQDRVGIKVSTRAAPVASTHPAVVAAVAEGLVAAGVDPSRIIIWDRRAEDMRRAGYAELAKKFRVVATDEAGGYSDDQTVLAAVMGKLISGDHKFTAEQREQTSSRSHLSRVLTEQVDKVVHLPALTDSVFSGVHGALAGMVLDNLDNWRRLARAPHFGDPFLPELYSDPRLGGRVVLTILDALRPQYAGGPFPGAEYRVNYGALFASRDPVALDATGMRLLDDFRREAGMPLIADRAKWPLTGEALGLGTAREEDVNLVRTSVETEVRWGEP